MAIKKSELYSSLWAGCDALRGGMDASQYKDYVLVLLFVKYVSDKYANDPNALIDIPPGGSFNDIRQLKHQKNIGEGIDTAIGMLAKANQLENVIDVVSFNDEEKLGRGKEMVDRLTDLVAIFEQDGLNFSKNRAQGDDILGDAYEYLMMHFATESGKSKGQFYTPAEVSRVMAKVLGIKNVTQQTSFYDPACGSGSLLLKVFDEAGDKGSLYGQEKEVATAGLAKMNTILHGSPMAQIQRGHSTLANPLFLDKHGRLETFDYVVANPPFSLANWTQGFDPRNDLHERFTGFGIPPEKNGDFAFLLHIVKSLNSTGRGAVILPHGVLFRGGAEAAIRRALIEKGYIKAIIGLPANLFYGTGIPACIIVIDKEEAATRKGIFMIDAGKGFIKDGNKNRLREQDIHKITDVFGKELELPRYSRLVRNEEIAHPKNDYNLNIPRYIDGQEPEDVQDIAAHLSGGMPNADIQALGEYWQVYPSLQTTLFAPERPGYSRLLVPRAAIKATIFNHPEFVQFTTEMNTVFAGWQQQTTQRLKQLTPGFKPRELVNEISEQLLTAYTNRHLIDKYDVYQHLMNYWHSIMQDDCYLLTADGWKAEPARILVETKTGKKVDKGWICDLLPPPLVVNRYFATQKAELEQWEAEKETTAAELAELEEEHGGEEGFFATMDKINRAAVHKRFKELTDAAKKIKKMPVEPISLAAEDPVPYGRPRETPTEQQVLEQWLALADKQAQLHTQIKTATEQLDRDTLARYATLTEAEIKQLVVEDKWMAAIQKAVHTEMERVSQRLTQRINELAERYATPLPELNNTVTALEEQLNTHLTKMGFVWN
ncbi:MAG: N-6 DNA methylase [Dinghuibacter sp.]|nr:N-6 DNA methylase [Dinghuibacter sp.]